MRLRQPLDEPRPSLAEGGGCWGWGGGKVWRNRRAFPPLLCQQLAGQPLPHISEGFQLIYCLPEEGRAGAGGAGAGLTLPSGALWLGTLARELALWLTSPPLRPDSSLAGSHRCCSFPAKQLGRSQLQRRVSAHTPSSSSSLCTVWDPGAETW